MQMRRMLYAARMACHPCYSRLYSKLWITNEILLIIHLFVARLSLRFNTVSRGEYTFRDSRITQPIFQRISLSCRYFREAENFGYIYIHPLGRVGPSKTFPPRGGKINIFSKIFKGRVSSARSFTVNKTNPEIRLGFWKSWKNRPKNSRYF